MDALTAILEEVSHNAGRKVLLGEGPTNRLLQSQTQIGGNGIVARALMARALDSTQMNFVWETLYDADTDTYFVNIAPAVQELLRHHQKAHNAIRQDTIELPTNLGPLTHC